MIIHGVRVRMGFTCKMVEIRRKLLIAGICRKLVGMYSRIYSLIRKPSDEYYVPALVYLKGQTDNVIFSERNPNLNPNSPTPSHYLYSLRNILLAKQRGRWNCTSRILNNE
jgi:hypothetical protein